MVVGIKHLRDISSIPLCDSVTSCASVILPTYVAIYYGINNDNTII